MTLPLRLPLRIPSGRLVRYNELRTIDPETLPTEHADWLLIRNRTRSRPAIWS